MLTNIIFFIIFVIGYGLTLTFVFIWV